MRKPNWGTRPAMVDGKPSTPVYRLARGSSLEGLVLSQDITGTEYHWLGRSVPHIEPSSHCRGCLERRDIRWEGFICIFNPRTNAVGILPVGPQCVPVVDAYLQQHESLRGAKIIASRASLKNNASVQITLQQQATIGTATLPPAVDIQAVMAHLWRGSNAYVAQPQPSTADMEERGHAYEDVFDISAEQARREEANAATRKGKAS